MRPAKPATPRPIPPTIAMPTKPSRRRQQADVRIVDSQTKVTDHIILLYCDWPFFKALSMSFSSSRACLLPGSFLRRVRMYFRALSYSWKERDEEDDIWWPITRSILSRCAVFVLFSSSYHCPFFKSAAYVYRVSKQSIQDMNRNASTHFESVVGHCKVEEKVPGVVLWRFLNKF